MKWIDEAIVVVASSSNVSPCLFVKIPHLVVLVLGIIKRVNRKLIRFMLQCHGTKIKICRKMNTKEIKNWIEIKIEAAMCAHVCSPKRCIVIHIQKQCPMVIVYKLPCLRPIVKWEALQNVIAKKMRQR